MKSKCLIFVFSLITIGTNAQVTASLKNGKPISPDLFGIFFEDLNYAGDGGLYAELIENRSFEYSLHENENWSPFTAWKYFRRGFAIGTAYVETSLPVHPNNPHYVVLTVDVADNGIGFKNSGFDGIAVKAGEKYDFSIFLRQISEQPIPIAIQLVDKKDAVVGQVDLVTQTKEWKKYTATIIPTQSSDSASLVILAKAKGKVAMDVISLFPQKTFRKRTNGLRADLAQAVADLKPAFMRFPGGCLVHGDGLGNMFHWKNTIGPIEERVEQRNIWNYHQTSGLGYFEYFQFCEDIGAKPLPVVPAGVSCNNSGQNWNEGQQCIPMSEMNDYVQDVLDLIEYANGPAASVWGAKRAAAGHPAPFNLQYIGVGNEDRQTPGFRERFKMIYDAIKAKYPAIIVMGTVGGLSEGEDIELGWKFGRELNVPFLDEHYYKKPEWFLSNHTRYDSYNRTGPKVYLGEYSTIGSTLYHALCEASYMVALERNGDVVRLSSYAPLLAKEKRTQWATDLIYFTNRSVFLSVNYYVQQLFSLNDGDRYFDGVVSYAKPDSLRAASCVSDSKTGDVIIKLVNVAAQPAQFAIDLSRFKGISSSGDITILSGDMNAKNSFANPHAIEPDTKAFKISKSFQYNVPASSLTIIRVKTKK